LDQYKHHQDKVTGGIWNTEAEIRIAARRSMPPKDALLFLQQKI
jgi:hypothetical protein